MRSLTINDQEQEGTCDFSKAQVVVTKGLQEVFGDRTVSIV